MAAHSLNDDVARLTAIVTRQHQGGLAERMRQSRGLSASEVGKACGTSPEVIGAWERGLAMPTTGEALAWLSVLYVQAGNPLVFAARSQAEAAEAEAARQAEQAERLAAVDGSW
jgi:transcriptional regulator with XRE-family HTH domain